MSDIVQRLRVRVSPNYKSALSEDIAEAADEIERLRAEVADHKGAVQLYCDDYNAMKAERDAAIARAKAAEKLAEKLAKVIRDL